MKTINQQVRLPLLKEAGISLYIKREDEIHPLLSGNKYRKLKYNIDAAKREGNATLLTFGGAFSNHIAATAYAGKRQGLRTIGVIRGEELQDNWDGNPTLELAAAHGMTFHFLDRDTYRQKQDPQLLESLMELYGPFYLVPEGGTNALAIKGCEEILKVGDGIFSVIAVPVGTGGTMAGLVNASQEHQRVLGFPALKGDFVKKDLRNFVHKSNWEMMADYHFGGYAKVNRELIDFINTFSAQTGIPLDPIYTGKMVYGILDMIKRGRFAENTKILAIHTGGLQGVKGMNHVLKKKNLPSITL